MKVQFTEPELSDFKAFRKMQEEVLPDVQKFDEQTFLDTATNKIILCKDLLNNLLGFAILKNNGSYGLLRQLAVEPNSRRNSIATKLVRKSEEWFRQNNVSHIKIWVKQENIPALDLYDKLSYQQGEVRKQYILSLNNFQPLDQNLLRLNYKIKLVDRSFDTQISKKFNIPLKELSGFRDLYSNKSLGVFLDNDLKGFIRLRPNFPIITPVCLENPNRFQLFLTLLLPHLNQEYNILKITTSDPNLTNLLEFQYWCTHNFSLVEMFKKINI